MAIIGVTVLSCFVTSVTVTCDITLHSLSKSKIKKSEGIHSREWYIGKKRRFKKCKESSSRVWEKNEYKSKKARKVRLSRRTRL